MRDVGDDVADIKALSGGLDPRDDPTRMGPGFGGVSGFRVIAHDIQLAKRALDAGGVGRGEDLGVQGGVLRQAEDVLDVVGLAPGHDLPPAIMTIAANGDDRVWPVHPDTTDQPAQMGTDLLAARRLSGAQDGHHAMAGVGVVDMEGQEAPFVVMGVEQRKLLVAVDGVGGIVDVERDRLGWMGMALAPQIHHGLCHADQGSQVRFILPA